VRARAGPCVRAPGHARLITLRAPQDVDEEAGANDADAEAEEAGYAGGALGGATGPLPGTVETRHRKNEEYMARRARLQSQYPNLAYQQ